MDFSFTDEQELLKESIAEFCERYIDEKDIPAMYENHSTPHDLDMAYLEAGFGMMGLPEEYGGIECDMVTLGMLTEEFVHHAGFTAPYLNTTLAMRDMVDFGSPEQIKMCFDAYQETGKPIFSLGFSEPGAGSDNQNMSSVTRKQPDGTYLLNGQKTWVTLGGLSLYTMVVAKDEDPSYENDKYSLWLVPNDAEGFTVASLEKVGQQAIPFVDQFFDNVVVTEEQRIGEAGMGWKLLMKKLEFERCLVVASSLGLAQAALNDAGAYANDRVAFKEPIARISMIQQHLCEMENIIENVRWRLYRTVTMLDNGESTRLESALLKGYACRELTRVADLAMSIYAAIGYTKEMRIGRIWADLRGNEMGGGTTEVMEYIAGRQLAKKYKA